MAEKTKMNTGKNTSKESPATPRRRILEVADDDLMDTSPMEDDTPQEESYTDVETPINTDEQWSDDPRKGYFGGRPGPGRKKKADGTSSGASGLDGEGEPLTNVELKALLDGAIRRRGDKFWDSLVKDRPTVAAQLRGLLAKQEEAGGGDINETVNIITGNGIMAPSENMRQIDRILPDDLDAVKADDLRAEVRRLRRDLAQRQDNRVTAQPGPDAIECPTCVKLVSIRGRMIPAGGDCPFCGQLWIDAKAGRITAVPQEETRRKRDNGFAYGIPNDDDGWVEVPDLSAESIRQATSSPRRNTCAAADTIGRLTGRRGLF